MAVVEDIDLENLMAELEAQNEVLAAREVSKPTTETVTNETAEIEADDLEGLVGELEGSLAKPTQMEKDAAAQQVQVEGVFEEPANPITDDDLKELENLQEEAKAVSPEPESKISVEPQIEAPKIEEVEQVAVEPESLPSTEQRSIDLTVEPKASPGQSEKSIRANAELRYRPDALAFQRETKITDATLDQCMIDQSALVAYYTAKHAEAEAQVSTVKMKFEILEAGLYDAYRRHFTETGEKVTEKAIENSVRLDVKWAKARKLLIEAQMYADTYKGFVSSLRDRCSILMQRGADRREEMKGQIRTVAKEEEIKHERTDTAARALNAAKNALSNS